MEWCCPKSVRYYNSPEEQEAARRRSQQIDVELEEAHRTERNVMKLILLGTGESGKSTMKNQMQIIHGDGFTRGERMARKQDIEKNVFDSMLTLITLMPTTNYKFQIGANTEHADYLVEKNSEYNYEFTRETWDSIENLWEDPGIKSCYTVSSHKLFDCAKYFLDKIAELRAPEYEPTNQDILRCCVKTETIDSIDFTIEDERGVIFRVFDIGGQQQDRGRWITMFNNALAIIFLADMSSFDQTLKSDPDKNRLYDSLETIEVLWFNRYLQKVSILLFLNKIDVLINKISRGRSIEHFADLDRAKFPDYANFDPPGEEIDEFNEACTVDMELTMQGAGAIADINFEAAKTAVYIKHLYQGVLEGRIEFSGINRDYLHKEHYCKYFYTCAVDTDHAKNVLDGCRAILVRRHLENLGLW